jgi:hypothetical protein
MNTPLRIDAHARVRIVRPRRTGQAGAKASAARPRISRPRKKNSHWRGHASHCERLTVLEANLSHHLRLRRDLRRLIRADDEVAADDGTRQDADAIGTCVHGATDVCANARRVCPDIEIAFDSTLRRHGITREPSVVTDHRVAAKVHRAAREHGVVADRAVNGHGLSRCPGRRCHTTIQRDRSPALITYPFTGPSMVTSAPSRGHVACDLVLQMDRATRCVHVIYVRRTGTDCGAGAAVSDCALTHV